MQRPNRGEIACLEGARTPKIPLVRFSPRYSQNTDEGRAISGSVVAVNVEFDVAVRVGAKRMRCIEYRIARDVPLER